jgi:hypothetical protein
VIVFFVVFGAGVMAFCLLALLAMPRAGRLVFFAERVELPPSMIPPWCFLGPPRFVYSDVTRWGTGEIKYADDQKATVLVFAVASAGGARRTHKLTLSNYADRDAVRQEFQKRLPPPRAVEIGAFGGITFRP